MNTFLTQTTNSTIEPVINSIFAYGLIKSGIPFAYFVTIPFITPIYPGYLSVNNPMISVNSSGGLIFNQPGIYELSVTTSVIAGPSGAVLGGYYLAFSNTVSANNEEIVYWAYFNNNEISHFTNSQSSALTSNNITSIPSNAITGASSATISNTNNPSTIVTTSTTTPTYYLDFNASYNSQDSSIYSSVFLTKAGSPRFYYEIGSVSDSPNPLPNFGCVTIKLYIPTPSTPIYVNLANKTGTGSYQSFSGSYSVKLLNLL